MIRAFCPSKMTTGITLFSTALLIPERIFLKNLLSGIASLLFRNSTYFVNVVFTIFLNSNERVIAIIRNSETLLFDRFLILT